LQESFYDVTEISGEEISKEQLERMHHRYAWARNQCKNKSVVEVACGSGQGLGIILEVANSLVAGDCDQDILEIAKLHYRDRVQLDRFDALDLPFDDNSIDVIINFEAIYYLRDCEKFVAECNRVLRVGGKILIATANKDLADFNPSPNSYNYLGTVELEKLLAKFSFDCDLFGYMSVKKVSVKQRIFRPIKWLVVKLGLMPKSMKSKRLFKRIVFGELVSMPHELVTGEVSFSPPIPLQKACPNTEHKVIYCTGTKTQ